MLSLRERSKSKLTSPRIQAKETPSVGDVVQLKEDNISRGSWKLGRIIELITSNDGQIRAAKVRLANKNVVNRPLKLLYPLECKKESNNEKKTDINDNDRTERIK